MIKAPSSSFIYKPPTKFLYLISMKEEGEIQCHGFFILLSSLAKGLSRISISMIHPLPFIYLLAYISSGILHKPNILDHTTRTGTKFYNKISDIFTSDWTEVFLFKLCHFIIFLIVWLLSTSAVVYTLACIYTTRKLNIKKVLSVVSNVWKRLIITFMWSSVIVTAYNVGAVMIMSLTAIMFIILFTFKTTAILVLVLFMFHFVGFVYLSLIWQLACVVAFVEDIRGLRAMTKSQDLIKGKLGISLMMFLMVGLCGFGYSLQYDWNVVSRRGNSVFSSISFGVFCLMLQMNFMLLRLIIHTIVFFVFKSFHHVNMDKSSLSDDLEVYL